MSKERKKPPGTNPAALQAWGIVVRLRDGSTLYYFPDRTRAAGGRPLELWGRESQAHRFPSHEAAATLAERMQVNSDAKEYLVVPMPE